MRELETDRLILRRVTRDDVREIFDNWASDPEVPKYMTWYAHESTAETNRVMDNWIAAYEQPDCYRYVIELKEEHVLIGMIDVVGYEDGAPVIGYCSGKRFWGNGYMTEALKALVAELLDDGYDTILVSAVKDNIASNRVIQKAGFEFVSSREGPLSVIKPEIVTINYYRLRRK